MFTADDVQTWYQSQDRDVYLSDVVDASNGDTMSVGFARYAPGESNDWVVTYDEALISLMERIWGPLERGESDDFQPFFDALAEDVVFELPVGEARGKDAAPYAASG